MQLGMVGLGRMGADMTRRLMRGGHTMVVSDLERRRRQGHRRRRRRRLLLARRPRQQTHGAARCVDHGALRRSHGKNVQTLLAQMEPGDTIIDGGNSYFKDDVRRASSAAAKGVHYVDVGTSGGVWGLDRGYCMMIGGPKEAVQRLDPIFKTLAPGRGDIPRTPGFEKRGGTAGRRLHSLRPLRRRTLRQDGPQRHRVRHDAGLRGRLRHLQERHQQGSARGHPLRSQPAGHRRSLAARQRRQFVAAGPDRHGAVRKSYARRYSGFVQDSGEGRWTIQAALEEAVPAEVLTAALYTRFRSRQEHTFAEKMLSAMRQKFGGHVEPKKN